MTLRRSAGDSNDYLELLLYHNRFQLATSDALYSDDDHYLPAVAVIKDLKESLPGVKSVLVLGTGLGSIVHVMRANGYDPHYTLVEKDKTILGWALELLENENGLKIAPVCNDASVFIKQNSAKYDLVFIDIFNGRVVPEFVSTSVFLEQCRDSLSPGGSLAFNYIENDKQEWENTEHTFASIFPVYHVLSMGINRILINTPRRTPNHTPNP